MDKDSGQLVANYKKLIDEALEGASGKALYKAATGKKSDKESLVGMARENPGLFGLTKKNRQFFEKKEDGQLVPVNPRTMNTDVLKERLLGKARNRLLDSIQTIAGRR